MSESDIEPYCFHLYGVSMMAVGIRYILSYKADALGNRVEISTPMNSWKRAVEGVSLWKRGINPYDSDIIHESPFALAVYDYLVTYIPDSIDVLFIACDLLVSTILSHFAKYYLEEYVKKEQAKKVPKNTEPLLLKYDNIVWVCYLIEVVYLLNPYSVFSCAGRSTVLFQNLLLAFFLFLTTVGYWLEAGGVLAFLTFHSFYYCTLLVPLVMYVYQTANDRARYFEIFFTLGGFVVSIIGLLCGFRRITGSWRYLESTFGCILSVPDLTPNIGLFWYFFTEMFEHFRVFFLCIFQLNVFVYTIPLAVRLRKDPIFLMFVHIIIISIFKSYPCIGEVGFYLALLTIWSHLLHFMRQKFIVCCVLASCTLLAPTLWHLWIYSGSANANFYFAITLAFNTGQVFLLTDILSAFIKREYYFEKGVKYNEDGSLVLLRLQ
ncbi:phosphatidylinositol glycan anchor biosynthesis class U protein-like [Argiope bruennichi]|uniref:Phosphatidylinositol glycan anchor like protein n=1 Tax=Argiope bruennichi TaxID=94029 RepID=A0A8T0F8Q0_ARGBR|nr:phosphatidylinositol glycan anchor biosynthesis class U protein-like [Argiope bruennichi]KAF8787577.1 Phosphatidylinositol glycan anchor like protein [Argiope bruennichi]